MTNMSKLKLELTLVSCAIASVEMLVTYAIITVGGCF